MKFIYKLERKFSKYAIPNLMMYIIFGQAIIFLLSMFNPNLYYNFMFSWSHILQGEIWRLVTFIFIPDTMSPIWFMITALVYYSIGSNLERTWGTFNFNFYYFISIIGTIIVAAIFNIPGAIATYVNLSLFLSFATLVPDATFYIYFVIPVKAKYMLIFYFIILGSAAFTGGIESFALIAASLLGYFFFFGLPALKRGRVRQKAAPAQRNFQQARREIEKGSKDPIKVAFHKCTVCGKTEVDDPEMDFRYCSKCNGHHEYCMDHLKDHTHIE